MQEYEKSAMTMPSERTRSVIQAREFLVDLSRDKTLPEALRTEARRLLGHYPTADEVLLAGKVVGRNSNLDGAPRQICRAVPGAILEGQRSIRNSSEPYRHHGGDT